MTALQKLINNLVACGQTSMAVAVEQIAAEGSDIASIFQSRKTTSVVDHWRDGEMTHRGSFSQVHLRSRVPMAPSSDIPAQIARATWIWLRMRAGKAKWDATALIMNGLSMTAEDQDAASRHADLLWEAFKGDREKRAIEIAKFHAENA